MLDKEISIDIQRLVDKALKARSQCHDFEFVPGESVIPPSGKVIGSKELEYMVQASLDGWLTAGRFNAAFEKALSEFIGVSHVLSVNSGSSANLVAFHALTSPKLGASAIKPGDEVITVAAGFPTTVNPIVQFGAVPVFVDIDIKTLNIDVSKLEEALSNKTKAVMIAHTLGNPFDAKVVRDFCRTHGLWLVEDCCDALGAKVAGQHVGTFGDIGTLSFYPAHHITMGEGGAVFTKNDQLKLIAESYRDWGRDCYCDPGCDNTCGKRFEQCHGSLPEGYDHKYVYSHLGFNLKISDMQAACGLAQLDSIDSFVARRNSNFEFLTRELDELRQWVSFAQLSTADSSPSWFGFPLTLRDDSGYRRVDLVRYLDSRNVGTRLLFAGNLTRQPSYSNVNYRIAGNLVNTDRVMRDTFWVGVYPGLNTAMLGYAATSLKEFFGVGF